MKRRELRELMHCCRPDLSDLTEQESCALKEALERDAKLRSEWQSMQTWDSAIERAMHDVPLPAGLMERLVAAVESDPDVQELPDSVPAQDLPAAVPRVDITRRHWLTWPSRLAAGVLVTTAVVLLAMWLVPWGDSLTVAQVVDASGDWIEQLDPEAWRSTDPPVADFPLDPTLRLSVVGWQPCSTIDLGRAVVYRADLPPASTTGLLFVIQTRQGQQLPTLPPLAPNSTTGNVCIGVWKNNGCLFVLIVPGNLNDYRRTLRTHAVA